MSVEAKKLSQSQGTSINHIPLNEQYRCNHNGNVHPQLNVVSLF